MNQAYNPTSPVARWQKRISAISPTRIIRSPYRDRPEWVVTEAQQLLVEQVLSIPEMSTRRRAAMLGHSQNMVQHTITMAVEWGMLNVVGIGQRGVKILAVAKDWIIQRTDPDKVMSILRAWRERRKPQWAATESASTAERRPPSVADVVRTLSERLRWSGQRT